MLAAAASWLARLAVEAVGWRRRAGGLVGGRAGGRLQWSGGCRSALNLEGRFLERFPGLGADAEHARVVSALVAQPGKPTTAFVGVLRERQLSMLPDDRGEHEDADERLAFGGALGLWRAAPAQMSHMLTSFGAQRLRK